jgi:hypothetical protein
LADAHQALGKLQAQAGATAPADCHALEAELSALQSQVAEATRELSRARDEADKTRAELGKLQTESGHRVAQQAALCDMERPRREQLRIMREFCRSKAALLSELSGFALVPGAEGAALDPLGRLVVEVAGQAGGKHRLHLEFDAGTTLVHCGVTPPVTADGQAERAAERAAVAGNDAAEFVRQVKRLAGAARELGEELAVLQAEAVAMDKRRRFILSFKPATRVVSGLFRLGSYQASIFVPADYPCTPARLVEIEDISAFRNFDRTVERLKAELGPDARVRDWVHALQRELGGK